MNPALFIIANTTTPTADDGSIVILVIAGACLVVLVVMVLLVNSIGARLARIEERLANPTAAASSPTHHADLTPEHAAVATEGGTHGDFERFLAEDPKRLLLGKKEQSAAYRAWRKEHGLTWRPPAKD